MKVLSTSIAVFDETENIVLRGWPTLAFLHSLDPKRTLDADRLLDQLFLPILCLGPFGTLFSGADLSVFAWSLSAFFVALDFSRWDRSKL